VKRTPLQRRTPLKGATLQRGGSTLPRARVKPRSDKRVAAMEVRRPLVARLLTEFPVCQVQAVCRGARAVDVHERLKRSRGGSITDPAHGHMVTACRACHDWTEREPAAATAARMLLPSWHKCPPVGPC
jgi:hypothetical protein